MSAPPSRYSRREPSNHRQPSRQTDYAEDQGHRWILKKYENRFHGGLSAGRHGQRDENALQPDQLAQQERTQRHCALQRLQHSLTYQSS
jgi:hypothetical protein